MAIAFIILLAAVSIISKRVTKSIVKPIHKLADGVREISGGNLDKKLEIHTGDELEHLATCFNAMTNDLKAYMANLAKDTVTSADAEQKLSAILQANEKIAVDMAVMEYISSAGLRILLRNAKQAKCAKKNFVLFGASGMIKEVLEASGMDMLVKIYETSEDLP